ncbi:MAG: monomethylamine:corrinoid methyltransferase [Ignavibacteriales bacterium]
MNRILNLVLGKYEETIKGKGSPNGFGFHDLYDTVKLVPKPEYKELYLKVKSELAGFGLTALK